MPTNFKNKIRSVTLHIICELCTIVYSLVLHGHWKLILSLMIPTKTNFYEFLRILKIT